MPIHLNPTSTLAPRVLLPGDPGRALALAQSLLNEPLMFNHNRGLWGYTGQARIDGEPLTIQSTGMGGPSAAIVLRELIALGAGSAIRVGTCGALDGSLRLGELVIVSEAIAADGTSQALGAGERISADGALTAALQRSAPDSRTGTIVTTDLFYDRREREAEWLSAGALAIEMEAATLFALGEHFQVPVACLLTVSDVLSSVDRGSSDAEATSPAEPERERIDEDALLDAAERMGEVAVVALGG